MGLRSKIGVLFFECACCGESWSELTRNVSTANPSKCDGCDSYHEHYHFENTPGVVLDAAGGCTDKSIADEYAKNTGDVL
ncbi:hypothetical protein [Vibrio breoganii]|uniref:hypothetical protein n=1 Tax=Vibrio breoganii TaxID=553239 RepID=UPI000C82C812|nr:hypothetical protein [Vibrio breoganii]PMK30630.1 hypothetical protein BCU03_09440 [Vibrio breoganii]